MGKSVRRILRLRRKVGDPSIVIAANSRPTQPDQPFRRLLGPQRSGNTVSEVDDMICRPTAKVGQDRFERQEITVDVGKDRDAHALKISGNAPDASEPPSRPLSTNLQRWSLSTIRDRPYAMKHLGSLSCLSRATAQKEAAVPAPCR